MNMQAMNPNHQLEPLFERLAAVDREVARQIVGQARAVELLKIGLLAGGHCLLEGVPGVAKTLMAHTLADALDLTFKRVQFTPDLMPSDIIGTEVLQATTDGARRFEFEPGPVFTQVLLADEINRAPPKTQAALLEAMQEKAVTYAGETRPLPQPFFVLATQNPLEQAGTYPLPEAELDRFLLMIDVHYPDADEEIEVLRRTTGIAAAPPSPALTADQVLELQRWVREVVAEDVVLRYAAALTRRSRPENDGCPSLVRDYVRWGAGPRAGQGLILAAKARALLDRRYAATREDVRAVAHPVLKHRLILNWRAESDGVTENRVIDALLAED